MTPTSRSLICAATRQLERTKSVTMTRLLIQLINHCKAPRYPRPQPGGEIDSRKQEF